MRYTNSRFTYLLTCVYLPGFNGTNVRNPWSRFPLSYPDPCSLIQPAGPDGTIDFWYKTNQKSIVPSGPAGWVVLYQNVNTFRRRRVTYFVKVCRLSAQWVSIFLSLKDRIIQFYIWLFDVCADRKAPTNQRRAKVTSDSNNSIRHIDVSDVITADFRLADGDTRAQVNAVGNGSVRRPEVKVQSSPLHLDQVISQKDITQDDEGPVCMGFRASDNHGKTQLTLVSFVLFCLF